MFHFDCCYICIHIPATTATATVTAATSENNNNDRLGIFCDHGIIHKHYIIIYINVCTDLFFQRMVHE